MWRLIGLDRYQRANYSDDVALSMAGVDALVVTVAGIAGAGLGATAGSAGGPVGAIGGAMAFGYAGGLVGTGVADAVDYLFFGVKGG
ncbi:MAG: hypothetical protein REI45_04830 [Propionicimonas sp.]|nr:hypothetical protein [Propionicimonas sp.]